MEEKPFVSFIIAVYNIPTEMVFSCLDSILKLSLRKHEREIIVVDDGSKTPLINHLDNYLDDIIYIRQKNGGLSCARNRGLQNATGQYIQFVDADDALITNQYEHCLDLARFQSPDMVMFDFSRKDKSQKVYTDQKLVTGRYLLRHQNIKATACGYLFKSTILGNLHFTPGIYHEDEEFTPLLILRAGSILQTDAEAYYYRTRENSITTSEDIRNTVKRLNDFKSIIYRLYNFAAVIPGSDRMALLRRVHQLTMDFIYLVIIETRNKHYLNRQLEELHKKGLFPLPDKDYTTKYKWFRRLTNTKIGMAFLFRTLPLIRREQ
jgi:glycosyltransferase involved in cell wall biosynthesis